MHLDKDYHLLILNLFSHNLQLFQLSSVQATVDAREPIRNLLHKVHEGARFMYRVPDCDRHPSCVNSSTRGRGGWKVIPRALQKEMITKPVLYTRLIRWSGLHAA